MKKIILICLFSTTFFNFNYSQTTKFGLKAGANYANFKGGDINTSAITSFHGGLVCEIELFKNFNVQPELLYSTQGASYKDLENEIMNELGYVSIPVMAKFSLNDELSLEIGPQASFLLSERNKVSADDYNTFDFSVMGGLSYKLTKNLFVQGRYGYGLTDVSRTADIKNTLLQASIGVLF